MNNSPGVRDMESAGEKLMRESCERCARDNERNRLDAVYLVEADDFAQLRLWIENAVDGKRSGWDAPFRRMSWAQETLGYGREIGRFGGMSVCVTVSFARIKGHVVAFYEATSLVVDHRMVEEWLKVEFPASRGKTNATNFHLCLDELDRVPT